MYNNVQLSRPIRPAIWSEPYSDWDRVGLGWRGQMSPFPPPNFYHSLWYLVQRDSQTPDYVKESRIHDDIKLKEKQTQNLGVRGQVKEGKSLGLPLKRLVIVIFLTFKLSTCKSLIQSNLSCFALSSYFIGLYNRSWKMKILLSNTKYHKNLNLCRERQWKHWVATYVVIMSPVQPIL